MAKGDGIASLRQTNGFIVHCDESGTNLHSLGCLPAEASSAVSLPPPAKFRAHELDGERNLPVFLEF